VVDQSSKLARAGTAATGRGVLVVALVAAFGLAGCGRKAGLDAPPLAAAGDQQAGQPGSASGSAQVSGPDGKPNAPASEKRHSLLDWLID
jgi:hypothetical protein